MTGYSWEDGWEPEFDIPRCEACGYKPGLDGHAAGCPFDSVCHLCDTEYGDHAGGCPNDPNTVELELERREIERFEEAYDGAGGY